MAPTVEDGGGDEPPDGEFPIMPAPDDGDDLNGIVLIAVRRDYGGRFRRKRPNDPRGDVQPPPGLFDNLN